MENTNNPTNNGGKNMEIPTNMEKSMENMEKQTNMEKSMENIENPTNKENSMEESTANGGMDTGMEKAPLYDGGISMGQNDKWKEIFDSPVRYADGPVLYKGQWYKRKKQIDKTKRGVAGTKKAEADKSPVYEATDGQFRFLINMSIVGYEHKHDAVDSLNPVIRKKNGLTKWCFREHWLTVDEFLDKATHGYNFCGLFRFMYGRYNYDRWDRDSKMYSHETNVLPRYAREKKYRGALKIAFKDKRFFYGTQTFFVDIDKTLYPMMEDFIAKLSKKPTAGYYTFSDKESTRKFRLVYIFDKVYTPAAIAVLGEAISQMIERDTDEKIEDNCGKVVNQYFNGTDKQYGVYVNHDAIYSIYDFAPDYQEPEDGYMTEEEIEEARMEKERKEREQREREETENNILSDADRGNSGQNSSENSSEENSLEESIVNKDENKAQEGAKSLIYDRRAIIDMQMVEDMKRMSPERFYYNYRSKYIYYTCTQYDWSEVMAAGETYIETNGEFMELYRNPIGFYIKNGGHRRRILFERMCERRLMKPWVNINEILYNAREDMYRFIDNYDRDEEDMAGENSTHRGGSTQDEAEKDIITVDCLVEYAQKCFEMSLEEIEKLFAPALEKIHERYKNRQFKIAPWVEDKKAEVPKVRRKRKDKQIGEVYDLKASLEENLKIVNEMGVKACIGRLRQFRDNNGLEHVDTPKQKQRKERDKKLMLEYNYDETRKYNSDILGITDNICIRIKKKLDEKINQYDINLTPPGELSSIRYRFELSRETL